MINPIKPSAEIVPSTGNIYADIERAARISHSSQMSNDPEAFVRKLIRVNHLSCLEFGRIWVTVRNTASATELVDTMRKASPAFEIYPDGERFLISGNARQFREFVQVMFSSEGLLQVLHRKFPDLFYDFNLDEEQPADLDFVSVGHETNHYILVKMVCSRSISHQIVRHRLCSFMQESQRRIIYKDGLDVILPKRYVDRSDLIKVWKRSLRNSLDAYHDLCLRSNVPVEVARGVLPNDTATSLYIYASPNEWKHIFKLRCALSADEEMRRIMIPLEARMKTKKYIFPC